MKMYDYNQTYNIDEDIEKLLPILQKATDYHSEDKSYIIPVSYWGDKAGRLYIKWHMNDQNNLYKVCRYWLDDDKELVCEVIPVNKTNEEKLRGIAGSTEPVVLITGDTHREFDRVYSFCSRYPTTKEDIMIILGDAGINYYGGDRDKYFKKDLSGLPITFFCIHGNHEMRPATVHGYKTKEWHGGLVYVEDDFPNLIFAKDGEIYDIAGKKVMVIGGAYSVDKDYRLKHGHNWFADEQPSDEIKEYVEAQLDRCGWKIDVVLSHTTPYQYRPTDKFMSSIDQYKVDNSTEQWLRSIEERLTYDKWYAGHYHCDRKMDNMQIMYENVESFCNEVDELGFRMR